MNKQSAINKKAWEHRAYEFWLKDYGSPEERAKIIMENPMARLKQHGKYFSNINGLKIANPCGSNGRRAVALALLGADVTVFDISEENKKYALELAQCSHVKLDYIVGDLYDVDMNVYGNYFDMLYLEGGILHYFHDIDKFMKILFFMLKPNGQIILNDFHPFRKVMPINIFKSSVGDYFDTNIYNGDVSYKDFLDEGKKEEFPECSVRLYNISEILNSMIKSGFIIKEFNEDPSWTNKKLPGEITVYAIK
ncbi:class I SAM-dependent methyltransferase [Clostridium frigidicarnis]|uniref:Methyltransferase domain-containing protein n=1 Tax=Clostridium frigidicarnis TaxID=84698 RepID=A0A1I0XSH2_9CLOT|nr:class I SAM-dependent methyltransferase [Clostridium frigidicarnis]SFB03962.1 Methyltransferase domain-containing protein [Clostridium frigidicarnis]